MRLLLLLLILHYYVTTLNAFLFHNNYVLIRRSVLLPVPVGSRHNACNRYNRCCYSLLYSESTTSHNNFDNNNDNDNAEDQVDLKLYVNQLELNLAKTQKVASDQNEENSMLRDELREISSQYSQERQLRSEEARKLSNVREELTRQLIANQRSANLEQSTLKQMMTTEIEMRENAVSDLHNKIFQLEQHIFQLETERKNLKSLLKLMALTSRSKLKDWAKRCWCRIKPKRRRLKKLK